MNYLFLPKEVSPTEKAHVDRINRIALYAFYLHIPIFAGVAWLCDTGPLFAVALSVLTLVGPTLAYFMLDSHRSKATVFGFTAMCMGGLLVHFGQGPMQIEMHFYFFVLLALLAVYGNPAVNLVAAVTAAVHHLTIWLLLPASVFNYDASIWVVLVHALFVVIETVAAVFIARSFYDNVIGLEKIVQARTREVEAANRDMRVVLDNVSQGLLTVSMKGEVGPERSRIVETWLGAPPDSNQFIDWLSSQDERAATWFQIGLEELEEDILPSEVILDQLPKTFRGTAPEASSTKPTYALQYQPIRAEDGGIEKLLVVISDITAELLQAESEARQRETLRLFELIASDGAGFSEFYREADKMLRRVVSEPDLELKDVKRLVHTLKGNTAIFGLDRFSKICHELEDHIETSGERPMAADLERLEDAWKQLSDKVEQLSGEGRSQQKTVDERDLDALLTAIESGAPHAQLQGMLRHLQLEPSSKRLASLAEQAQRIAERLGREDLRIEQDAQGDIRFESEQWASFWASLVHVFRNAVDHGLEAPDERKEHGKEAAGRLAIRTFSKDDAFVLEVEDDGRGIDIERLREKVRAHGREFASDQELLSVIFEDGVSTKNVITETSGRGVGMAAVRSEVEALGGRVEVNTEQGQGTRFSFVFPLTGVSLPHSEVQS